MYEKVKHKIQLSFQCYKHEISRYTVKYLKDKIMLFPFQLPQLSTQFWKSPIVTKLLLTFNTFSLSRYNVKSHSPKCICYFCYIRLKKHLKIFPHPMTHTLKQLLDNEGLEEVSDLKVWCDMKSWCSTKKVICCQLGLGNKPFFCNCSKIIN